MCVALMAKWVLREQLQQLADSRKPVSQCEGVGHVCDLDVCSRELAKHYGTILYHTTLHTHTGRTFCFLRPIYNVMTTKLSLIFAPPAKFAVSVAKLTINSHSVY